MSDTDLEPAAIISLVQKSRLELLQSNEDIDDKRLMLMRDLSKTAIDQVRITVDETSAAAEQEMAATLSKVISAQANPFLKGDTQHERVIDTSDLPDIVPVKGEMDREMASLTYEDFYNDKEA